MAVRVSGGVGDGGVVVEVDHEVAVAGVVPDQPGEALRIESVPGCRVDQRGVAVVSGDEEQPDGWRSA
ncbi:hypothetical protein [Micromonospora sp. NPDC005189]|uniref:hypothetical protein n=1 Tax=unclassified Micromonospora TaxID=2617518 RepID=UPI0033A0771F